jgi:Fe-S-cluster-containing dehydrogenase component/DMSO reductase anchor subunit
VSTAVFQPASATLVDALLDEQRDLSAAARFARWHDRQPHSRMPAQRYRALMPVASPGPGEQYAFEVELDACSGCKACVTACHALNGLEEEETWRRVGLLVSDSTSAKPPLLQHVTTACHHCVDPACLAGCPVLAYDKDPLTGIVRHLDDQCIGCTYCVMMCPYEVPQYSRRLGIVRKCDMCHDRLLEDEAPACVQACPTAAIRIKVISQTNALQLHRRPPNRSSPAEAFNPFLPFSPSPALTVPTTRYVSRRHRLEDARAANAAALTRSPAHRELIGFLLLSQGSVGLTGAIALDLIPATHFRWFATAALIMQSLALAVGTLHLGQPTRAWRAFLGWRTSWFSREVIMLGLYTALLSVLTLTAWIRGPVSPLAMATFLTGAAGVLCSVMIYSATGRSFWRTRGVAARFLGTTATPGLATAAAISADPPSAFLALTAIALPFAAESLNLRRARKKGPSDLTRSADLIRGPLRWWWRALAASLVIAFLSTLAAAVTATPALYWVTVVALVLGGAAERFLFFAAVSPDRMPGALES